MPENRPYLPNQNPDAANDDVVTELPISHDSPRVNPQFIAPDGELYVKDGSNVSDLGGTGSIGNERRPFKVK